MIISKSEGGFNENGENVKDTAKNNGIITEILLSLLSGEIQGDGLSRCSLL
jgi:hypothetical protein